MKWYELAQNCVEGICRFYIFRQMVSLQKLHSVTLIYFLKLTNLKFV